MVGVGKWQCCEFGQGSCPVFPFLQLSVVSVIIDGSFMMWRSFSKTRTANCLVLTFPKAVLLMSHTKFGLHRMSRSLFILQNLDV